MGNPRREDNRARQDISKLDFLYRQAEVGGVNEKPHNGYIISNEEVKVWTNTEEEVCLIQAEYVNENGELIEGELPELDMSGLKQSIFETNGGDYLLKIEGTSNADNIIVYLSFTSRYGKKLTVGRKPTGGSDFTFAGSPEEIPTCLYGGYQPRPKGMGFSMCHLGCELVPSW